MHGGYIMVAYAEKGTMRLHFSWRTTAALTTTSYFQGTWFGNWQFKDKSGTGRDVIITVGPQNPDGSFDIEYSWGRDKIQWVVPF